MTTSTTFANGQTLTSSALTEDQCAAIFQMLLCQMLGYVTLYPLQTNIAAGNNVLNVGDTSNLQVGYDVTDANIIVGAQGGAIPDGTVITNLTPTSITMSNPAVANVANATVYASNPASNTAVRIAWNTDGAPAWSIGQDVLSIQVTEEDDHYNRIRDRWNTYNDSSTVTQNDEYTRAWRVSFVGRGPNAFDRIRIIKSAFMQDWTHDTLASSNLYLVPELTASQRSPELFEGQWWEVTTWHAKFYEQVNETLTVSTVASVEVIVENANGVVKDFTVTL